jgi:membrane protein required for beta-lactamase induction
VVDEQSKLDPLQPQRKRMGGQWLADNTDGGMHKRFLRLKKVSRSMYMYITLSSMLITNLLLLKIDSISLESKADLT